MEYSLTLQGRSAVRPCSDLFFGQGLIPHLPWLAPVGLGKHRLPLHKQPVGNRGYLIRIW